MTGPRIGSLFSGYGGLDLGAVDAIGGSVAWHVENDPHASRILEHHWPDTPNYGDITAVDWAAVEPVDVLTGGFPCQDVSHAGGRAGLRNGTRSGLWSHMAHAVDQLRPALVVIENVRGLLSADADSDLEPCPWCVGDDPRGALRALGAVLGDLADLRYDARWVGVRAADVGAPHGRFRVFITAWPAADTDSFGGRATDPIRRQVWGAAATGSGAVPSGTGATQDPDLTTGGQRRVAAPGQTESGWARPDPRGRGRTPTADTDRDGLESLGRVDPGGCDPHRRGRTDLPWGAYEPAVRRWEHTLRRPAPNPTQPGAKGGQTLNPAFVEWMMGLAAGWVTDVPGLSRNHQLKALGNGVVPQQAAYALRLLLTGVALTPDTDAGPLLPTPAVNDMGAGKTVEKWDTWTAAMRARHGNGNGHGPSLHIEAARLTQDAT